MYNMDISILGFKLNLEVLILIGVVYLILVGHMFCGCCNFGLIEGFDGSGNIVTTEKKMKDKVKNLPTQNAVGTPGTVAPTSPSVPSESVSKAGKKEGFTGANINYGESSRYSLTDDHHINTSSWNAPDMTVVPGQPLSAGVKKFLAREPQPVPLPEGEMLMFANTRFAPEFCPNTYSTSSGCAEMTGQQYNFLRERGGNNVPYSEY
jgi:hypothetical protein